MLQRSIHLCIFLISCYHLPTIRRSLLPSRGTWRQPCRCAGRPTLETSWRTLIRCCAVRELGLRQYWSMFTAVIVSSPLTGEKPLSMLYLEGLGRTIDIVCYENDQILDVLDEWYKSCGVSLYMHTSHTCMHEIQHSRLYS